MVLIYNYLGCFSGRKVKRWLSDHQIQHIEIDILKENLTKQVILNQLVKTENEAEDVIINRSNVYKKQPTILKKPIIIIHDKMVVGYNENELTIISPQ